PESRVDSRRGGVQLLARVAVLGETVATRLGDLHKDESSSEIRALLQYALDREKFFVDPFRVIESIDTNAQRHIGRKAQLANDMFTAHVGRRCATRDFVVPLDADGIGANLRVSAAMSDHTGVAIDLGAKGQLDGLQEVRTVCRRLESGDITSQQTFDHLSSPG